MPKIFTTLDKIRPAYDITYKVVLFICKILLIADILITTMSVIGRYVPFIPDPSWSEEVVLTCMSYMAVLSAALAIRRGAHIRMTAFDMYLPKKVVKALDILSDVAVMILGVDLEVIREVIDAGRKKGHLDLGRASVAFGALELGNDLRLVHFNGHLFS